MIELRTLLIALLVPTLAWAQPSQPSNTDQPEPKATETGRPKAEPDLRGTPQAPLSVEIVPTAADKEKERRELTLVTGLLFIAAFYTAWTAERSSAKALDASTKATETLIKVERAYVTGGGYSRTPVNSFPGVPRLFHLGKL